MIARLVSMFLAFVLAVGVAGPVAAGQPAPRLASPTVTAPAATISEQPSIVSAGSWHACALTTGRGIKCWGANYYGQLGDGTTTDRPTATGVVGLSSGIAAVSAGEFHTCAVTTGGGVKCWGSNYYGHLGDGTTTDRRTPVDVVGLSSGVVAVSAGVDHTCALTTGGGVKCWGRNDLGQLGNGTTTDSITPVDVMGLSSDVIAISTGLFHTCAVTTAGGVKCWGHNYDGQLGNGTTVGSAIPVDVVGLSSGVATVSTGHYHTCAVATNGGVKCWGRNDHGQLGDGTGAGSTTYVDVVGLANDVVAVSAGFQHTCAVAASGGVSCWGRNDYGQLGDGTSGLGHYVTDYRASPVEVVGLTSSVTAVSAGFFHTCAETADGKVKCWGWNYYGQLGNDTTSGSTTPVDAAGLSGTAIAVSANSAHTCALAAGRGLTCWGRNDYGQLGDGTKINNSIPVDVVGLSSGVATVSTGSEFHTCALTTGGGVKCWGLNGYGQLGDGTSNNIRSTPVDVVGLASNVAAISAGVSHTCAVTMGGGVKCWGNNSYGQLGTGTTSDSAIPVDVQGLSNNAVAASGGASHTCALTVSGGIKCWGLNDYGQLGDGTTADRSTPVDVVGLSSGVTAVSAGGWHTCALTAAGGVKCWGANPGGQLGDGTFASRSTPGDVVGLSGGVAALSSSARHTCALTAGGGVRCWGSNGFGQLGDGTTDNRGSPVPVTGLSSGVAAVAAGFEHTCVLTAGGGIKCWGHNDSAQLGANSGWTPVDVLGLEVAVYTKVLHFPYVDIQ